MPKPIKGRPDPLTVIARYEQLKDASSRISKAAHFLDFCAKEMPGQTVAWNLIARAIGGLGRTPGAGSEDVRSLQGRSTSIRNKLMKDYGRGLDTVPGVGARATVDDDDLADTQYHKQVVRIAGAQAAAAKTATHINPSRMKKADLKGWFVNSSKALGEMNAEKRLERLLPAKKEE